MWYLGTGSVTRREPYPNACERRSWGIVPNFTFFWLSHSLPDPNSFWLITGIICLEKFGYGFGAVAHMFYMMRQIAPGPFKTAHYAFATGTMGLCNFLTGFVSGKIEEAVGYQTFFLIVLVCAIPGLLAAWFAPFIHSMTEDDEPPPEQEGEKAAA